MLCTCVCICVLVHICFVIVSFVVNYFYVVSWLVVCVYLYPSTYVGEHVYRLSFCVTLSFDKIDNNNNNNNNNIKRSRTIFECNQAIKEKFCQSNILIPVANGSTGATSVTTPCQAIIQLLLFKLNPTIKYFAYLWLQLNKSLAVDSFSCLFKVLIYN